MPRDRCGSQFDPLSPPAARDADLAQLAMNPHGIAEEEVARAGGQNGHDLKDPLLSPVYGDFHGFPPTVSAPSTQT